ncbi:MAG: transposase [Hyphomicrobiaceae bacterium]
MAVPKCRAVIEHLEVVETGRRRRWTEDEKLRIVTESLSGSRLVSSTARRYGISRSLLTTWRRQFRVEPSLDGEAGTEFVPAVVLPESPASTQPASSSSTRMEIVVSRDRRIIVDAGVDVAALARVLDLLSRR